MTFVSAFETLGRRAFGLGVLAAVLSGCAGNQAQTPLAVQGVKTVAAPLAQTHRSLATPFGGLRASVVSHPDLKPSWMSPEAKKNNSLLYVSDEATNDVLVSRIPSTF